ncbi:MAG: chorismate synthase, partial [Rhizobacter sp.]|nr:chorismate synthase [Chlorobiales bacterium]
MIRYLTAGESHGPALTGIVEGLPAGVPLSPETINFHLHRRQQGYGRGNRMKIETDAAEILSGVRFGKSIGSPIAFTIRNADWKNWTEKMNQFDDLSGEVASVQIPRPGHADFSGKLKYDLDDIRPVIDRSSARETATRVACGAIIRAFLKSLGIEIGSYISAIGQAIEPGGHEIKQAERLCMLLDEGAETMMRESDRSQVRMLDAAMESKAIALIEQAKLKGDTLGGIFEVFITGLPIGLGSYAQFDRKLDAQLAAAIVSIQAVKGVEIGTAFRNAVSFGSEVHDAMHLEN